MEDENVHVEHIEEKSMQERWQEVMNCWKYHTRKDNEGKNV
jgi:hypothetical protein